MFDPTGSSTYASVPPPPPPDVPSGSTRYVYLLGRLRGRQITMEEATELFAIQQSMIRAAARPAPPGSGAPPPPPPSSGTPSAPVAVSVMSDEGLALALLAFGTGAGVLAAVLKRGREGPAPEKPRAR